MEKHSINYAVCYYCYYLTYLWVWKGCLSVYLIRTLEIIIYFSFSKAFLSSFTELLMKRSIHINEVVFSSFKSYYTEPFYNCCSAPSEERRILLWVTKLWNEIVFKWRNSCSCSRGDFFMIHWASLHLV